MVGMDRARTDFPRTWEDVCNNPFLTNLPYRVEINREGNIVLSPHSRFHSKYQAAIMRLLERLMDGGMSIPECAIESKGSTPVADVVWISNERDAAEKDAFAYTTAPEICIEVRSPSNSLREMQAKRQEYFEAGAVECWFCNLTGGMSFYGLEGELERSQLCPDFPKQINFRESATVPGRVPPRY